MFYFCCIFYIERDFLSSCGNKNEIPGNMAKLGSKIMQHIFKENCFKNSIFYKQLNLVAAT